MVNIKELVEKNFSELQSMRRYFHENPELSGEEWNTLEVIEKTLDGYGITHRRFDGSGILAKIEGHGPGKSLLMRADIDGLPIEESKTNITKEKICFSKNKGVMHACGHDAHIAMLLLEAKLLNELKDSWPGRIVLFFEEGEEGNLNRLEPIIEFLESEPDWHIDTCYATHVRWDIPAGKVAVLNDAVMAGGFGFDITINGQGGHGSRPDLANSPIDCFTAFYHDLQAFRMRAVAPMECLTFSIGKLESGDLPNIIPQSLYFAGTSRFLNYDKAGKVFYEAFEPMLKNTCQTYQCTYKIHRLSHPLYEVRNNPICVELAKKTVISHLGKDTLYPADPWMASETFAIALRIYPGILTFTGIQSDAVGSGANHHTAEFDLAESGMIPGVTTAVGYALEYLQTKPDLPFTRSIVSIEDATARNL